MHRIKEDKILNLPDSIYKNIDTLAYYKNVKYKSIGDFFIPEEDNYIRFFSKGKLISYTSRIPLGKEYFRTARGLQGKYFVKNKKLYCLIYNYPYGASGILLFKNDTLTYECKNISYYYVKVKNVSPEWLEWQPDW
jgi:hypothetical protein